MEDEAIDAGRFTPWVLETMAAARSGEGVDVPCGACSACCTSSQFVHVEPDEADALAAIPSALLFPAPGLPDGHVLLGYDDRGRCPMFVDERCSIYDVRPRTCRSYDCRVVAAAGVDLADRDKAAITERVVRWRFALEDDEDRARQSAVRAAATYLEEHQRALGAAAPRTPTQRAFVAVMLHQLFLAGPPSVADVVAALG